jgi:hypothetical protein
VLVGAPPAPAVLEGAADGNGGSGLRFAVGADEPAPPAARADGTCRVPDRRVEGAAWDPGSGEFRPIPCRIADGVCLPGAAGVVAARLREVRHGVPGPWAVASLPAGRSGARAGDLRVEAWPAFLDVLAPLAEPLPPDAALVAWSGDAAVAPLVYRDGLTAGAGVGWARLAATGPLALAPEGRRLTGLVPDVRLARPGEETRYRGPGFIIVIPPGGRFFPGPLAVRTEHVPGSPSLPALSEAIDILPAGEALRERGVLRFELTGALPDTRALGIYRWNAERERWSFEGGDLESGGGAMTLRFRRYGRFALLQDASPPVVSEVEPRDGAVVGRRPRIAARVEEEGEGLGFDGVAFELDGAPLEAEFDPDRARAAVLSLPPLRPGPHRLRVVATDAAGNASEPVTASFTVR